MKKVVMITGGGGWFASKIARSLLNQYEIILLDNLSEPNSHERINTLVSMGSHFEHVDIKEVDAVKFSVARWRPSIVVHAAAMLSIQDLVANPRLSFQTNVLGTYNVVESVRLLCNQAPLIFPSSYEVYDQSFGSKKQITKFGGVRADTLLQMESIIRSHGTGTNMSNGGCSVVVRHGCMYQNAICHDLWPSVLDAMMPVGLLHNIWDNAKNVNTGALRVNSDINGATDALHIEDVSDFYNALCSSLIDDRKPFLSGKVFNIGGGVNNMVTLRMLINAINENTGISMPMPKSDFDLDEPATYTSDNLACDIIEWDPPPNRIENDIKEIIHEWTSK